MMLNALVVAFSMATAHASYSHQQSANIQLQGVPDLSAFGKLNFPQFDLIDLGGGSKDILPPDIYKITKQNVIKEPQPYPVKVEVPVHHPVHIPQPYPVVQTKIVHVPQPVPYEVIKKVPVPVEVPKPYPVPAEELKVPEQGQGHYQGAGSNEQEYQQIYEKIQGYHQVDQGNGYQQGGGYGDDQGAYASVQQGYQGGDGQQAHQ